MEFKIFRGACRFASLGYNTDDAHMNIVCKKKIPPGESWGKCDEAHCPYYGMAIRNIEFFQEGKLIATAESGKIAYGRDKQIQQK